MKKIDINKALFQQLQEDYISHKEHKHYQSQLQAGFDYMEAIVKFFGVVSISVVKSIDEQVYKDIFTKNFKLAPSLGDFKSLATTPFSKNQKKLLLPYENKLYNLLHKILTKKIEVELLDVGALLIGDEVEKKYDSIKKVLDEYAVGFRNKLKGHGASFRDDDTLLRELTLQTLDTLLNTLIDAYSELVEKVEFFLVAQDKGELYIEYDGDGCVLLPIVSYKECDKFSCALHHRTKLFFYNDGKENKSHYIDYSYNHFDQITQRNEIHISLEKLQAEVLHATSNTQREAQLLANFVGREKELQDAKEHLIEAMNSKRGSFFCVMGKPGIGKSAFLTQLQFVMKENPLLKEEFNSFTFYAQKDKMGGSSMEEAKYFFKQLLKYFLAHNIKVKEQQEFSLRESLEELFLQYEQLKTSKPLVLIVDGLDEFEKPSEIISSIPLEYSGKIHIVFSSRPYRKIKDTISSTISKTDALVVLFKEQVLHNGYSFELGKLLFGEVEELLSQVLSKDIARESQDYVDIVKTIAEQTESLPLYIYYIMQQLKEYKVDETQDIVKEIKKFALSLPPQLSVFYTQHFKSVEPLSRDILYLLYFSYSSVARGEFYTILKSVKEFKDIDEITFVEKYFNAIEVFLDVDSDGRYTFYHLSVQEQLVEYLQELEQFARFEKEALQKVMIDGVVTHYEEYIEKLLYIKKGSDIYNLLESLTRKVSLEDTKTYYINNYFHLLNRYVWANIYIAQIDFESMQNKNYAPLTQVQELPQKNKQEIEEFFRKFEQKEQKQLLEIEYAYNLALFAQEYKKLLYYKDMYENYAQNMFLDIALNIDKKEYIQKFLEHKDVWLYAINQEVKEFLLSVIAKQESLDDSFLEVLEFVKLDDEQKKEFAPKFSPKKGLEVVESISSGLKKVEALMELAEKGKNQELLQQALDVANSIYDDGDKSAALVAIVEKTEDKELVQQVLEIADSIYDDWAKSDILEVIIKRIEDQELLEQALDVANSICDEGIKSETLRGIVKKIENEELLKQALEIAKDISFYFYKPEALKAIVKKTEDQEILQQLLEIVNDMPDDEWTKLTALEIIASKIEDKELLQQALEIAESIDTFNKASTLAKIAKKVKDNKLFKQILKIVSSIFNEEMQLETLEIIAKKTEEKELLKQALEIANSILDNEIKSEALVIIAKKTEDTQQALEIANSILDNEIKSEVLVEIALKTEDVEQALEIVKSIPIDWVQTKALKIIIRKTKDKELLQQVLEVVDKIFDDSDKSEALATIAEKAEDKALMKQALEIVKSIPIDWVQTKALKIIIKKTKDKELLQQALEIVNNIYSDEVKRRTLLAIALKMKDTQQALEIANSILDDSDKSEALAAIVSKIEDIQQALEIVKSIPTDWDKAKALAVIVEKTEDQELLQRTLEIVNSIDSFEKSHILEIIAKKLEVTQQVLKTEIPQQQVLEIAKSIDSDEMQSEALEIIAKMTQDTQRGCDSDESKSLITIIENLENIQYALKIVNMIPDYKIRRKSLVSIVAKIEDNELLQQSLEITNGIVDDEEQLKVLEAIVTKIEDRDLLQYALEVAKGIFHKGYKSKALAVIAKKTEDAQQALEIANSILDDEIKSEVLVEIALKMEDVEQAFNIVNDISSYYYEIKSEALAVIAKKTEDAQQALEIANSILDDEIKSEVLVEIALKMEDTQQALEIANSILDNEIKSEVLAVIAKKTENTQQALEIVNHIYSDEVKRKTLLAIALKMEDIQQALEIANSILDNEIQSEVLAAIAKKTKDTQQALEIINGISDDWYKSEALEAIIKKIEDQELLQQALEIIKSMSNDEDKLVFLLAIAPKTNNPDILKQIFTQILSLDLFTKLDFMEQIDNKSSVIKEQGIFFRQLFNNEVTVLDTIEFVTKLSSDTILDYYGINVKVKESALDGVLQELQILFEADLDKKEKRLQFKTLKEKIASEDDLLQEFIERFGEALELEDADDFEEEFTLKDLETLFM